ncbi:GvpL/GvpF family gas vesicle protein [Streptomyces sp. ME02-6979-3A]|uniref:Gas vesicle protein n=2 Tax=Streptomyces TaxID=1883 RepID=A0A652KPG2_9ACTN|nr:MULTISPECIES: GvpL/GvpF family gas vesicle protein [unclassified Streptomyces]WSS73049.1 GvpL/GvpF family gas vesicle protein [Streptomyces sp. NBC_01175]MDX3323345.1 GvpL/GvpF family gas vesicle protein [Streptomyces sp. ME02-6979-3A]MDX3432811.1 GvpL/GvpF family gas vesicle protein [Streptomyces sp. ME01-18a]MDX3685721.1 GvpL/GvpF family gas vesicle protein [Streptomyces sp. AK04-4c]TXS25599.1 gas vesicle protein [Streptomyces sp. gb1(2016)]
MTERGPGQAPDDSALYVFAVCDAPDPAAFGGLPGVAAGQPLSRLRFGPLTAIVQTVRAADFTDEVWQARMADRDELERYARAHHDVVSAAAASCPTVPLPLATLYHGEDRARQALLDETERFRTALERTACHSEWGVKVYTADLPAPDPSASPPRAEAPAAGSRPAPGAGLAYLERKRGVQARRERRHEDALRLAETVEAAFGTLSAAGRRLRLHTPELVEKGYTQVLNATFLVPDHRGAELQVLARTLRNTTGARIDVSGPWVPYSFVGEV